MIPPFPWAAISVGPSRDTIKVSAMCMTVYDAIEPTIGAAITNISSIGERGASTEMSRVFTSDITYRAFGKTRGERWGLGVGGKPLIIPRPARNQDQCATGCCANQCRSSPAVCHWLLCQPVPILPHRVPLVAVPTSAVPPPPRKPTLLASVGNPPCATGCCANQCLPNLPPSLVPNQPSCYRPKRCPFPLSPNCTAGW